MQRFLILMVSVLMLVGLTTCNKHVIRNPEVYKAEVTQSDIWAMKLADLTVGFMEKVCTCDANGAFTTKECADAADYVLTVQARHEWHMKMTLFNGQLLKERPSEVPPVIPESKTLCPATAGGE